MKTKGILVAALLVLTGMTVGADSGTPDKNISNKDVTVIIVRKGKPGKHIPGLQMEANASIVDGHLYLELPFDEYPVDVEVELLDYPGGFWTGTLYDAQSPIDGFEGHTGEYSIILTTAENIVYAGYFVIE